MASTSAWRAAIRNRLKAPTTGDCDLIRNRDRANMTNPNRLKAPTTGDCDATASG